MAFRAGSFSQCVYAACQHLRSAELAAPGSCSTQPNNGQSQPAGPEGCDKVMMKFSAWASEMRIAICIHCRLAMVMSTAGLTEQRVDSERHGRAAGCQIGMAGGLYSGMRERCNVSLCDTDAR